MPYVPPAFMSWLQSQGGSLATTSGVNFGTLAPTLPGPAPPVSTVLPAVYTTPEGITYRSDGSIAPTGETTVVEGAVSSGGFNFTEMLPMLMMIMTFLPFIGQIFSSLKSQQEESKIEETESEAYAKRIWMARSN